jgi:diamine N-acetyltransferase
MGKIELRPITADNWKACIALAVDEAQQHFVPSNLYSIAEAQFYPEARSRAIYCSAQVLVGYVLYGIDGANGRWKVFRLMIDRRYQGQGYGRAAMSYVIADIAGQPNGTCILVSFHQHNRPAHQLYHSLGFTDIEQIGDHIIAQYNVLHK